MHGRYNRLRAKRLSERGRKMARARWANDRARRDAEEPDRVRALAEIEVANLPRGAGDALGCLQWTDYRTGRVRRWVVTIGQRADQVELRSPGGRRSGSHGWTWVMDHLRGYLAGRKAWKS